MPRAIADEEGYLHKGTKSHWTDEPVTRVNGQTNQYKLAKPTVSINFLLWTPQVVLIDAMSLINT